MASASLATNCKPCLGYSSKTAAVIALRAEGLTWTQVGARVGMTGRQASSLAFKYNQRNQKTIRTIELTSLIHTDLEREAHRRGLQANELAHKLLYHVVVDKLYSAVLD